MAFMLLGATLALLVLPPDKIIRDDGSNAARFAYSSVGKEGTEMLKLFTNWKMLLVLPAAWTSNFFYTYQFATSCRKRGLGSLLSLCLALPFGEEASPTSSGTRMDSGKKSLLTSRMDVDTLVLLYSSQATGYWTPCSRASSIGSLEP
jgi:hypothetical protein